MLRHLDIRDMLLIDRLELAFRPGLNVLTGETGAGKSILLDCLGFVLGWRGRADLVRAGASQGEVTAVFDLPPGHPARTLLDEAGFPVSDELIIRRVNAGDGRKTGWINDRRASGEVLRMLSELLVELHGQHDDRGLLNPRGHRLLLDAFAGVDLAPTRAAWAARRAARAALERAEAALAAARGEEEFLRHAVAELDKLDPQPGEEAELDTRRRAMQGAERIREDVARALQALGPEGAEGAMLDAARWLDGAAERAEGRLENPAAALQRALIELGEAVSGVEAALEAMDFDPRDLEATEERLFALRALARKHDVLADDLAGLADELRARLSRIDAGEGDLARLRDAVAAADAAYDAAAAALSQQRAAAAERLDAAMAAELAPLKMERAVFRTRLSEAEPGPEGRDIAAFTVATNPGAPAGPLDRIASGGELSRFLLALKVCLARGNDALVLIFDEIDRGVGGATADAVGRRLARLAEGAQVLVVTHSPQVAALGGHHFRVAKSVQDGMTTSQVTALTASQRIEEIARMLSGEEITPAAKEAARALLQV
ncbi:DNA repair protein RecN [Paracoccus denitrificans]|jgi:DNA repair protein RecN (Recombination protein N)|uniref:DNA repair protein RecN n=1 Tax=Paracoccus denitrificans (strain Pd 1222) TaxID=318586 RepID=A1BAK4_PARDP|nr:DNA repair protein RecN [Paracoccus denitrificans]ABL72548.1 DNA replication and repair protein RecN [Paracoccus denitrificans PD1222]MBB4626541.1 DNA repair protein RecN (Recombination protein N) [Paracoccus denitrificans]MCU7428817.1 DNA repair protein RecN [Paracoccus denitrificans]QAR29091.1 DNA repair protein RecN [Paracoccus denitrificans]UPV97254.1 DNA repair protein RecN [Paracoccus denitrificans]